MEVSPIMTPLRDDEVRLALAIAGCDWAFCTEMDFLNASVEIPARGSKPMRYNNLFDVLQATICCSFFLFIKRDLQPISGICCDCLAIAMEIQSSNFDLNDKTESDFSIRLEEEIYEAIGQTGPDTYEDFPISLFARITAEKWRELIEWFAGYFGRDD